MDFNWWIFRFGMLFTAGMALFTTLLAWYLGTLPKVYHRIIIMVVTFAGFFSALSMGLINIVTYNFYIQPAVTAFWIAWILNLLLKKYRVANHLVMSIGTGIVLLLILFYSLKGFPVHEIGTLISIFTMVNGVLVWVYLYLLYRAYKKGK
jgi:hypothetical protein